MMRIYLLFLLALIVTSQANEVSWNKHLNINSRQRNDDLNTRAYLDGGGQRSINIGRSAYDGSISDARSRGPNYDARRVGNGLTSRGDNDILPTFGSEIPARTNQRTTSAKRGFDARIAGDPAWRLSDSNHDGKVPVKPKDQVIRQTRSQVGESMNQQAYVNSINNLGGEGNILRTSDLNRVNNYGQQNYIYRPDELSQGNYASRKLGFPIYKTRNNLSNLNGIDQELNVEGTSYLHSPVPAGIVRSYSNENYVNNVGDTNQRPGVLGSDYKNVASRSEFIKPEISMGQHRYIHPDNETERKRQEYIPSNLDTEDISINKDSYDRGSTYQPYKNSEINPNLDPNYDYNVLGNIYRTTNDGYEAPHEDLVMNNDRDISDVDRDYGYGGLDSGVLVPKLESYRNPADNSLPHAKIEIRASIAAYNESSNDNNINSTDEKNIVNRGSFIQEVNKYSMNTPPRPPPPPTLPPPPPPPPPQASCCRCSCCSFCRQSCNSCCEPGNYVDLANNYHADNANNVNKYYLENSRKPYAQIDSTVNTQNAQNDNTAQNQHTQIDIDSQNYHAQNGNYAQDQYAQNNYDGQNQFSKNYNAYKDNKEYYDRYYENYYKNYYQSRGSPPFDTGKFNADGQVNVGAQMNVGTQVSAGGEVNADGQIHVHDNAWSGAYTTSGGGGQITTYGNAAEQEADSSGGTIILYTDTDLGKTSSGNMGVSVSNSLTGNKVNSITDNDVGVMSITGGNGLINSGGSTQTKIVVSKSTKSGGGIVKTVHSGGGIVKTMQSGGGKSVFSTTFGANPYLNLINNFSKTILPGGPESFSGLRNS